MDDFDLLRKFQEFTHEEIVANRFSKKLFILETENELKQFRDIIDGISNDKYFKFYRGQSEAHDFLLNPHYYRELDTKSKIVN